jgi:hypothetical protein
MELLRTQQKIRLSNWRGSERKRSYKQNLNLKNILGINSKFKAK